jgi:hypothetical protein
MNCDNCQQPAHHIYTDERGERCEHCGAVSLISKTPTDGIITRNSWRIRRQQSRYEGDIVMPHRHNKITRRQEVNPDFVKLYPEQVKQYFSSEELVRDGYKKLPEEIAKNEARREKQKAIEKMDTFFEGDSTKAVESFLKDSDPTLANVE